MKRYAAPLIMVALACGAAEAQEAVEYYYLDGLGSVRAVSDSAGALIERHDYLPFGEECTTGACAASPGAGAGQPRKFTAKERDPETGFDDSAARYYAAPLGRFTRVDPLHVPVALVDPQQWNRYAYARNGPLKYVDPTGTVLELTGDDRAGAFDLIKAVAGPRGAALLSTREEDGRTFVEYQGRERDALAASGPLGVLLADIIDDTRTLEFGFAKEFQTKQGHFTTAYYGGAATVGSDESLNGNTQIFMHPDASSIMFNISHSLLGASRSNDGQPLSYTNAIVAAHEIGHAWAHLRGDPLYFSDRTYGTALWAENLMHGRLRHPNRRVRH